MTSFLRRKRVALAVTGLAVLAGCSTLAGQPNSTTAFEPGGRKRALIVAVAEYAPGTGWGRTSADNDLDHLRRLFDAQGFDDVYALRDAEATRDSIVRAFREKLLTPARPGDLVVFYYSGHGQQLTDDGDDEIDGYDEALVPFDAPTSDADGYRGDKHLRDDTLDRLIRELRRKLGAGGHVVAFLDSCFSGTPRGMRAAARGEVVVRGGPPLGPPRRGSSAREPETGFYEGSDRSGSPRGGSEEELASYVVFSAARHDQLAYETVDDDGHSVGSLTYALTREMAALQREVSYRWLYGRLRWLMARLVANEPQVEGDVDGLLFDGEVVPQEPFVAVESVLDDHRHVVLAAGWLTGLSRGARVGLYDETTRQPAAASRIASGTVVEATPIHATVHLDTAVDPSLIERGRAFVTRFSFVGQPRMRVRLAVAPPALERRLRSALETAAAEVELTAEQPDVIVFSASTDGRSAIEVESFRERLRLLDPVPVEVPDLENKVAGAVVGFVRSRALRALDLRVADFSVDFELIRVTCTDASGRTCTEAAEGGGGGFAPLWHLGETFKIRVHNSSRYPAYLNLLSLAPDGAIDLLWPPPHTGDMTPLPAGLTRSLPSVYQLQKPEGSMVFLLVASQVWLDVRPFLNESGARGGSADPSALLSSVLGERGDATPADSIVSTNAITLTVMQ